MMVSAIKVSLAEAASVSDGMSDVLTGRAAEGRLLKCREGRHWVYRLK